MQENKPEKMYTIQSQVLKVWQPCAGFPLYYFYQKTAACWAVEGTNNYSKNIRQ